MLISFAIMSSALLIAWAINPLLFAGCALVIGGWIDRKFSKKEKKEDE